jgi:hypothetical protein
VPSLARIAEVSGLFRTLIASGAGHVAVPGLDPGSPFIRRRGKDLLPEGHRSWFDG